MTNQEVDARQTALRLALDYPAGSISSSGMQSVLDRAEEFRRFLMGETLQPDRSETPGNATAQ